MSQNISEDVVNALLAGRDSPLGNTSKKTSQSSPRKPKCSGNSTKPTKAVALNRNGGLIRNYKEDCTDADNRLREFMTGSRSTQLKNEDGEITEHFYNPEGGKQYTLQEIADVMGVSRERVRQVEEVALRKMWRFLSIMNKREGLEKDDWFKTFNKSDGEATVYMP
jgi:hypothetical protein